VLDNAAVQGDANVMFNGDEHEVSLSTISGFCESQICHCCKSSVETFSNVFGSEDQETYSLANEPSGFGRTSLEDVRRRICAGNVLDFRLQFDYRISNVNVIAME